MNLKKKLGLKVLGLVVFSLLLAVNCTEEGTAPNENIAPNTFITNYQIDIAPDSATAYNARIYWSGNDVDGAVFWYEWSVINATGDSLRWYVENDDGEIDTINISTWQATNTQTQELKLSYPTFDTKYVFRVRAQDNDREYDPTPAVDTISIDRIRDFNYAPNTDIIVGPPNGAVCGQGINFLLRGTDIDGVVDTIAFMLEGDADWTKIPTDIMTGTIEYNLRDLDVGAHTITFKAIDNFRKEDPTPVSVSVIVTDTLAPEMAINVVDGHSYIVPYTNPQLDELVVSITGTVDFYYSYIDSFRVITSMGDDFITTETEATFTALAADDYWIEVIGYDIGGNSTSTGQVNFRVVELAAGDGVLCINGVDWGTYSADNTAQWNAGTPWGERTHYKIWDVFDSAPLGSLNPNFTDSLLGVGSVPAWMLDTLFFDAISWFANVYSDDDTYWLELEDEIMAYLEMGGNIYLPSRRAHFLFFDDLNTYAHVSSWLEDDALQSGLTSVYVGMPDIERIGSQTFSSVPTTDGSADVTVLYTSPDHPGASPGFIVMPNGEDGGGKFCFIAGRNYRWDHDQLKEATEFILATFFGIEN